MIEFCRKNMLEKVTVLGHMFLTGKLTEVIQVNSERSARGCSMNLREKTEIYGVNLFDTCLSSKAQQQSSSFIVFFIFSSAFCLVCKTCLVHYV